MAKTTEFPTELTQEVYDRLSAPVPAYQISTKSRGGRSFRFTSDKFVYTRLNEVVGPGGWQDDYSIELYPKPVVKKDTQYVGVITCRLKVLDVMKSATVDIEFEERMYGTPSTNAQARVLKRAAMKFGVAAELWEKDAPQDDDDDDTPRRTKAGSGGGKYTKAVTLSAKQQAVLKERGFTDEEIARNTSFKIIDALFALDLPRGKKMSAVAREKFLEENGALPASTVDDDDDDYEDEDDDE